MQSKLSIFILCGGKSTRMGREKGLVAFREKSFVEWVLEAVKPFSAPAYLVTSHPGFARFGYPIIADRIEGQGPVAAIHTALEESKTPLNLILSCDIPLVRHAILERLVNESFKNPHSITYLAKGTDEHYPLIGVYPKALGTAFGQAVEEGKLKLIRLVQELPHIQVQVLDEELPQLTNVNSPDQLDNLTTQTYE